ncbi:pseudouridine synthase [Marinomonas epiphytica]
MTLPILFQDEHLVAINKPSGLLVHRTHLAKGEEDVVVQRLRDQIGQWVFPVHRLDRGTSGVLLLAFTPSVAKQLGEQFSQARSQKTYHCLVRGHVCDEGLIDYPLAKVNEVKGKARYKVEGTEKEAQTQFHCLDQITLPVPVSKYQQMRLSWLEVTPKQGRKHQIRRHFKHVFNPLVGDSRYGCRHTNQALKPLLQNDYRLMLHASKLLIEHPITKGKITLEADLDNKIVNTLNKLNSIRI